MTAAGARRAVIVPAIAALLGLSLFVGLGTWQLERKAWKEALIATLNERLRDAPVSLPPSREWPALTAEGAEFLRVHARIEATGADDALVYASGSALRDDVKSPGYFVFTPVRLPDGSKVVVNRGYVPDKTYPRLAGAQDIVGVLRWPEQPSWFVAAHDTAGAVWTVRDHRAMAARKDWGEVAPFYIEQESPVPPGGRPHPAALTARLRNEHLQYAMTWYALALVVIVMSAIWARRRKAAG